MDSSEQYLALREGAGLVDRSARGRLLLTGNDRRSYLQGLLTNDIEALTAGRGCYAAYLTAQGRMISDMRVFETGDAILMDLEGFVAPAVRDRLSQFVFSEDVEIQDLTAGTTQLGIYGPLAARAVAAALTEPAADELQAMPPFGVLRTASDGSPLFVLRSDDIGVPGFDIVAPAETAGGLRRRLRDAGAVEVDEAVAETARIEAGRPRFGVDMGEDTIPLEAGIEDRAISLTKGCYVGQEIIIRVLHRGHGRVARRLVRLVLEPDAGVPERDEPVRSGDREIGRITSATRSPRDGRPTALGYVHRDFAEPGTRVLVGGGETANITPLSVVTP